MKHHETEAVNQMPNKKIFEDSVKCPKCATAFKVILQEKILREAVPAEKERHFIIEYFGNLFETFKTKGGKKGDTNAN